jgi:hypothetical protein
MTLEDEVRRMIGCMHKGGGEVMFSVEHRALIAIAKAYDDLRTEMGMLPAERPTALELAALVRERGLAGP